LQTNGEHYAVKIFKKTRLNADDVTSLLEEVSILRQLNHVNIISMYDFVEESAHFYVVLELVKGGELFDRIAAKVRQEHC
jgi:serine/threonine protein kinase